MLKNPHSIIVGQTLVIPPSPAEVLGAIKNVQLDGLIPSVSTPVAATVQPPSISTDTPPPAPKEETNVKVITPVPSSSDTQNGAFALSPKSFFTWRKEINKKLNTSEKLAFSIRWKFITVGSATMEINGIDDIQGRKAYHIVTTARSAPFFDTFYKVRDTNESWMDTESLCSLKFASSIDENNNKKNETVVLDHQTCTFKIIESGKSGKISLWSQDVLSSLYYLRTKELQVGKDYWFDAHSGDTSWPLKVTVVKREKIKVPAGEFDCFVVEPSIRDGAGLFQAKGKLWVWLTADASKMPVMMRSKIAVGSIEALLTERK
jgi:hypothetical protein